MREKSNFARRKSTGGIYSNQGDRTKYHSKQQISWQNQLIFES